MKKFISHTIKGKTSVYECEVSIHRPRPFNLHLGEELYTVEAPAQFKGELWYSFFFFDTAEECLEKAKKDQKASAERTAAKKGCTDCVVESLEQDIPIVTL